MTTHQTVQGIPFLRTFDDRLSDLSGFAHSHFDADLVELIPGPSDQPQQFFDPSSHCIQDDIGEPRAAAMIS